MSTPKFMLASVLIAPQTIELKRVEIPSLTANQVLIRIDAVGVCGSDTHFFERGAIGDIVVQGPIVLGHESAGQIVAVGSEVNPARVGINVSIEPQAPCRRCDYCKNGQYHLCRSMRFYGAWPVDGSFAEYSIIENDFAHSIPTSMNAEQAALVEPVSVAVHANRRGGVTAGSKVLITGAGPIGILSAQVARAFGATKIVVSDPSANRRTFVSNHGATQVINPNSSNFSEYEEHFDVYIDASANAAAILTAFPTIRPGGFAVLVGMGENSLNVPIAMIQHREITLTGTYRYVNTWPTAIELILNGAVDVNSLVTGRYGLDQAEVALMKAKTDPGSIKTMIIPSLTKEHVSN